MREIRPSGSVEGVMGNHDPYSDMGQPSRLSLINSLTTLSRRGPCSMPPR